MKHASILIILLGTSLVSAPLCAQPALADDTLIAAQSQLEALEQTVGNADRVLAEPLFALAEEYRRRARYSDAHDMLDRGMQIVRINEGLYARAQLPYLEKKIENYSDWGDWDSARDLMEHLLWFHRTKTKALDGILIDDLMDLSRFHLRGISEDSLEYQTFHFRRASAANWLALAAGETMWSRTDSRLVPLLYSLMKQYHLQAVAVSRGGRTGYELRQIVPGSDWVRERSEMRRYFYDTGQRLLRQVRDIYSQEESLNPEAIAMTDLYLADWQLMFSQDEQALTTYALAFENLAAAELDEELINRYLATPSVLPEQEFHASLADAFAARMAAPALAGAGSVSPEASLYFAEWSTSFPYVRAPYSQQASATENVALFSFDIAGVTEISKWLSKHTVQEIGGLLNATLLESRSASIADESDMRERLQWLHFRPRLVDGAPQDATATLVYQPASQTIITGF